MDPYGPKPDWIVPGSVTMMKIAVPPPMLGYFMFGATAFGHRYYSTKRPRWLTRVMARTFFELTWVDVEQDLRVASTKPARA
jgi:hypothetical protein